MLSVAFFIVMLSVVMLNVIMFSVIILIVVKIGKFLFIVVRPEESWKA
jgi:hypothetical protein